MQFDVIILAGGSGQRMGSDKLLLGVGEDLMLSRAVQPFVGRKDVNNIILVLRKDIFDIGNAVAQRFSGQSFLFVEGGGTRSLSVRNGLKKVTAEGVLIHDGARPFVTAAIIDEVVSSVIQYGSGVPAIPITDSIRAIQDGAICGTADREGFVSVQTPQGFVAQDIKRAFDLCGNELQHTDESALYVQYIGNPKVTKGADKNIKITTLGNYIGLNAKVGIGYDIHKLVPFRPLVLGGIQIDYDKGCLAHSDGDAVIHALIDALLSAIGELDIGTRFADTDPKNRDIDSTLLLSDVMDLYKQSNFKPSNVSIIIIADKPKLADYIPLMKIKLSNILGISGSLIGISAKTTEGTAAEETIEVFAITVVT